MNDQPNSNMICKNSPAAKISEILDQTSWAEDFSWQQILVLGKYFKDYAIAAGSELFAEGEPGNEMGIVVNGAIAIYKENKMIAEITAGRTYGEMSLFDNEPRSATALALDDCDLLVIDKAMFEKLAESNPKLAFTLLWKIAGILSQNLRKTNGYLIDFLQ